jgi:hypothetical protein
MCEHLARLQSFEPGDDWAWCHVDEETVERVDVHPEESPEEHYARLGAGA